MSDKKLTKEKLVDELEHAFSHALFKAQVYKWRKPRIKRAYNQLKEIIEEHFEYIHAHMETHTHEGTQQKPTVTREEIQNIILDIDKAIKEMPVNYLVSNDLKIATDVLAAWLKTHGVEVKK